MHIRILAIGTKMPTWVEEGYYEYAKRFTAGCKIQLVEIPSEKRSKSSNIDQLKQRESDKVARLIKSNHRVIALDVKGKQWSTEDLANQMKNWQQEGKNIDLLIGGPDGFSDTLLQRVDHKWSLSALTFPHPLVRILLIEQLYRAMTFIEGHPYHRL